MLWQKKRSELPVNDNPQADWNDMRSLLDKHLPVTGNSGGGLSSKKFKLWPMLLVSLSAAAMTYFTVHIVEKRNKQYQHHNKNYKLRAGTSHYGDSLSSADSSTRKDSTANKDDSLAGLKQAGANNPGMAKPGSDKTANTTSGTIPAKDSSAAAKGGNSVLANISVKSRAIVNSRQNKNAGRTSLANNQVGHNRPFSSRGGQNSTILAPGTNQGLFQSRGTRQPNTSNMAGHQYNADASNSKMLPGESIYLTPAQPKPDFDLGTNYLASATGASNNLTLQKPVFARLNDGKKSSQNGKNDKQKNGIGKNAKGKPPTPLNLDWGILAGVNSSGSFTAKSQNANFYGSSPVDLYVGLFATYNINDKWGFNAQARALSPQSFSGTYTHANQSKVDSGQVLQITDKRKAYFVSIPVHLVYKATDILSFKAGPVINIPVKQVAGSSVLQPAGIKADSTYFATATTALNATKYTPTFNLGFSGGVSIHYQRLIIEATYLKGLSGQKVTSGLGNYNGYYNSFQFTIGFQLNKLKKP